MNFHRQPQRGTHLLSLRCGGNGINASDDQFGSTYAGETRRTSASERKPPLPEIALKWQNTGEDDQRGVSGRSGPRGLRSRLRGAGASRGWRERLTFLPSKLLGALINDESEPLERLGRPESKK